MLIKSRKHEKKEKEFKSNHRLVKKKEKLKSPVGK